MVDSPDRAELTAALREAGLDYEILRSGLTVRGGDPLDVGRIAAASGIALSTLQRRGPGLEEVFLDLVNGVRVHESAGVPLADVPAAAPVEDGAVAEAESPAEAAEESEVIVTEDVAIADVAPEEDVAIADVEPEGGAEPEGEPDAVEAARARRSPWRAPASSRSFRTQRRMPRKPPSKSSKKATVDGAVDAADEAAEAESEPEQHCGRCLLPCRTTRPRTRRPRTLPPTKPPLDEAPSGEPPADELSAEDLPEPDDDTWPPDAANRGRPSRRDRFFAAFDDGSSPAPAEDAPDGDAPNEAGEDEASAPSADTGTEHEG